jgi:sucrose-6-phosphate hydrolase SacC (GH32 family)
VYHTYTDNDPVKKPLSQEEAFKPIRNALIKEANALGTQLSAMESEELSGAEDVPFYLSRLSSHANFAKSPPSQTQSPSISKPAATRAGVVATSVARFGNSLSRTFRNKFYDQVDKSPMSVDSRLQREIEAKKKGQNLSM